MTRVASPVFHLRADAGDEYDALSHNFVESLHGRWLNKYVFEKVGPQRLERTIQTKPRSRMIS